MDRSDHIVVRDLSMGFGSSVLIGELNFTIKRGDIFVIMGGSGSGKSTLLRCLLGLKPPMSGEIQYGGDLFTGADPERRDRILRRFGVLFQGGALFSSMSLAENVSLPLELYTDLDAKQISEVARLKLALVGLQNFANLRPIQLSGGMQKRAGIARAMALDPEILFLDEPSAGLDPVSANRLDDLILELRGSLGATVVLVTHELDSIFKIADDCIFLDGQRGRATGKGPPRELLAHSREPKIVDFLTRGGERQREGGP